MGHHKKLLYLVGLALFLCFLAPSVQASDPVAAVVDEFLSTLPKDFHGASPKALKTSLDAGEPITVVDVRETSEYEAGHIEGAISIPLREVAKKLDRLPSDKKGPLVVICASGFRSSYATMALWVFGYRNLKNIRGGMRDWEKEGYPVVK